MTVLFLYTELADYFLKCCEKLSETCRVVIIRWPVNSEAPFRFSYPPGVVVHEKNNYSREDLAKLVSGINPDMIVCSGWIDKDYLSITRAFFKKIPTVLTCDTTWKGTPRQYLAIMLSRFFLLNTFSNAWVPGVAQQKYARLLGFRSSVIRQGFYCCDLPKFNGLYEELKTAKQNNFPKRFLYVGRYYEFKGITDLWKAFIELQQEEPSGWELWCLGTGSVEPVAHPRIRHFGFVQPAELGPILRQTGVFVLPSRFEPWGVVVQEYAAAGYPLLLSGATGAREAFLEEGVNGYSFEAGDYKALKATLKKITKLSAEALHAMCGESNRAAQKITPGQWVNTVHDIYHEYKEK